MGIRDAAGRHAAVLLAAAVLGAGLIGGPWAAPLRTEAQAPASGTPAPPQPEKAQPETAQPEKAQAAVDAAVAGLTVNRPANSVSVAAVDTDTGVHVGWGAGSGMTAASIFKLMLLEGSLLQSQDDGQPPGAGMSDALTAMIENSDNDAADATYAALGGSTGVASSLRRLGLSATRLGPDDQWGLSTTSAADQLTLLEDLVSPQSPLSSASRAYALGLMRNVESDQRWGITAAADPGTSVAIKNGWLNVDDDGGRWVVSSVGVIQVGGHQVLLAVLTQHDADLADGTALVESVSRSVATGLRNGRPPHR